MSMDQLKPKILVLSFQFRNVYCKRKTVKLVFLNNVLFLCIIQIFLPNYVNRSDLMEWLIRFVGFDINNITLDVIINVPVVN